MIGNALLVLNAGLIVADIIYTRRFIREAKRHADALSEFVRATQGNTERLKADDGPTRL